jgi:hypothetical protein
VSVDELLSAGGLVPRGFYTVTGTQDGGGVMNLRVNLTTLLHLQLRMCEAIPPSPSIHQRHTPGALHRPTTQTYLLPHTRRKDQSLYTDLSPYTDPLHRPISFNTPTAQTYLLLHTRIAQTCLLTQTHRTDVSPSTHPPHRPVFFHTPTAQTCLLPHTQRTDPSPNIHIVQWYFH